MVSPTSKCISTMASLGTQRLCLSLTKEEIKNDLLNITGERTLMYVQKEEKEQENEE